MIRRLLQESVPNLAEKWASASRQALIRDFDEVKLGFNEEMARKEAERCLSCGCTAFDRCDLKELSIGHDINLNKTGMGKSLSMKKMHPIRQ